MRKSQVPSIRKKKLLNQNSSNQDPANQTSFNQAQSSNQLDQSSKSTSDAFVQQKQPDLNSIFQVFSVVYGVFKPGKKHKEWTDDAILVLKDKNVCAYDLEGEIIGKTAYLKGRALRPDDTLMIGKNEYMIIDPIDKNDFLRRKCFKDFSTQSDNQPQKPISSDNKRKFSDYVCPLKESTNNSCSSNNCDEVIETSNKFLKTSEQFERNQKSTTKENEIYQIFKVLYGVQKPGKKHKEWTCDGILLREGSKIILYNIEGEIINNDFYKKEKSLKSDDILPVQDKEVLINDPISKEDFDNKRCFNLDFCAMELDEDPKDMPPKNSYKKVVTNQTRDALTSKEYKKQAEEEEEIEINPLKYYWTLPAFPEELKSIINVGETTEVIVDCDLTKALRDHQKEGVEFMYKCIVGFHYNILGCLCADEMGLGKTLQCITLIYTLFKTGPFDGPYFKERVLILTPSSLVQNWSKEFDKWLKNKQFYTYAIDNNKKTIKNYLKQSKRIYPVLIVSYETFQRNHKSLENLNFDLIVCDEAHRLKNSKTELYKTIKEIKCERRILLTGTPIQNNLKELFSICDLINPGILGSEEEFSKNFEEPIAIAQRALDNQNESIDSDRFNDSLTNLKNIKKETHLKLIQNIKLFFIRRLQSSFNYLPKRVDNILICNLTDIQKKLYEVLLDDKNLKKILSEESGESLIGSYLPYISFLRRLCNHPFLINSNMIKKFYNLSENSLINQLSPVVNDIFSAYKKGAIDKSGKFDVLFKLIKSIKELNDKIVIVSHFTQTLDLIEQYCRVKNYRTSRLDGSTPIANRQKLVDEFNSEFSSSFIFLLSSKAGGLGLNLTGASHIILYDNDWNPSHDEQSMARIFRDGQKKNCNIYRLLTVGTIDEKIFQRQLDKTSLHAAIGNATNEVQFSNRQLKDIFTLDASTNSIIHDSLNCVICTVNLDDYSASTPDNILGEESSPIHSFNEFEQNVENDEFDHEIESTKVKQENIEPILFDDESNISIEDNQVKVKKVKEDNFNSNEQEKYFDDSFDLEYDNQNIEDIEGSSEDIEDSSDDSEDSNFSMNLIRTSTQIESKLDYDIDEDFLVEESFDRQEIGNSNENQLSAVKPLSQWQHYKYPFEKSDMSSVLLQLKDKITFVFRNESE